MKKIKNISKLILLFVLAVAITGCSKKDENINNGSEEVVSEENNIVDEFKTVEDILGRKVVVKNEIESIVVTPVPYPSIIYAIDGTMEKMVAVNPGSKKQYENSLLKKLAPEFADVSVDYVSKDFAVNIEEVLNLNPDVVILWSNQDDDILKLEQMNIPVITLTAGASSDIEGMRDNMRIIGKLLNKEEKTENLINYNIDVEKYFEGKENEITEEMKPKVLYIRDKNLTIAAGESFNNRLISLTGGKNVASDVKGGWTEVSMEEVLNWNPEIIYLSNMDDIEPSDLYNNSIDGQDWSQIEAVKNKKVYKTPVGTIRWDAPCAETPLFMKWMGNIQHPEIFTEYNLEEDIIKFYNDFFGYDLSNEEISEMLNK